MKTKELKNNFDVFEIEMIAIEDLTKIKGGGNDDDDDDAECLLYPDVD